MKRTALWFALAAPVMLLAGCAGWYAGVDGGPSKLDAKQTAALQQAVAGKVAGTAQRCVDSRLLDDPVKISDDVVLYRVGRKLVYRNNLRGSCPGLANDSAFMVLRNSGGGTLSCDGDIIRMVDRSAQFERGSCAFGDFVPYRAD